MPSTRINKPQQNTKEAMGPLRRPKPQPGPLCSCSLPLFHQFHLLVRCFASVPVPPALRCSRNEHSPAQTRSSLLQHGTSSTPCVIAKHHQVALKAQWKQHDFWWLLGFPHLQTSPPAAMNLPPGDGSSYLLVFGGADGLEDLQTWAGPSGELESV